MIDEAKFVFPALATLDSGCAAVTQRGEPDPPGCRPTTHSNSRSFTEAVAWRTEALRSLESDARTETKERKAREPTAAPAGDIRRPHEHNRELDQIVRPAAIVTLQCFRSVIVRFDCALRSPAAFSTSSLWAIRVRTGRFHQNNRYFP